MSDPILSIRGLRKQYGTGVEALKSVDLDIERGEIFALLGPNGAGKTTLINIICGIVTASEGEVLIDGVDIKRIATPELRNAIALVPQDAFVFSETIAQNIALGLPRDEREDMAW